MISRIRLVSSTSTAASGLQFNISKGRSVELYNRVDSNGGANAALVVLILTNTSLEGNSVLLDKDSIADLLSGTTSEVTNTNYVRIALTDTELSSLSPDDLNTLILLTLADQTLTAIAAGTAFAKVVIAYDPNTATSTDTDLIPMTLHDFVTIPDGSDITIPFSSGFLEES